MAIGEQIRAVWSGPGRKWVLGGAALGVGYLWWTRLRTRSAAGGSDAATITPGGAAISEPVVPPGGDYSTPAEAAPRPASNGEWLQEVAAKLVLPPFNKSPIATFNALTKALAGEPLTTAEVGIVEEALRLGGTPPEGMPRINMASTAVPTATTPPPSSTSSAAVTRTVKSGDTLSAIASAWGVTQSAAYSRNAAAIEAAAKSHGLSSSRGGPSNSLGWWIFPGTVLTKP